MLKLILCYISLLIAVGVYCCLRVGAMYDRELDELEKLQNAENGSQNITF